MINFPEIDLKNKNIRIIIFVLSLLLFFLNNFETKTLVSILVLFVIFRDIKWVIIPLISTSYAILVMTGLIGLFNWEITAISSNFFEA